MLGDPQTHEVVESELSPRLVVFLADHVGADAGDLVEREDAPANLDLLKSEKRSRKDPNELLHLPTLADLPIPQAVTIGDGWTGQMTDLAEHMDARDVLLLCDLFGGQRVHVPRDWTRSLFLNRLGERAAKAISWLYGGFRFEVPAARVALERARRGCVIAALRAGMIDVRQASKIVGTTRTYLNKLINDGEGLGVEPLDLAAAQRRKLRRAANELLAQLATAGAPPEAIGTIWTAIVTAAESARESVVPVIEHEGVAHD